MTARCWWLLRQIPQSEVSRRTVSRANAEWRREFEQTLPDLTDDDIAGSGFAITSYTVRRNLGGDVALARLRERLRQRDLKLMLDFVPNHMAPDHPWVGHPSNRPTQSCLNSTPACSPCCATPPCAKETGNSSIDFQSALKALQNLIAPQEFGSIRVEVQSAANEGMGEAQSSFARHFEFFTFTSEGESEAEIGLDKVVARPRGEVITNFAENPNMGSKAVFESAADMPEHLIATRKVLL